MGNGKVTGHGVTVTRREPPVGEGRENAEMFWRKEKSALSDEENGFI